MKKLLAALSLALAVATPAPSFATAFSAIWIFGGPLEDVGNFASVKGNLPPPFYNNRFSNGPLAVEVLAKELGFTVTPSLHRVGPPQGNSFASADALAAGGETQDLHGQVDAYFTLSGNTADPNALYYMIIGGNEVIRAVYEPDDLAMVTLENAVKSKERAIERLVAAGARTLFVDNFFDIGAAPLFLEYDLSWRATKMARIHNQLMEQMLDRTEKRLGYSLIRFDVFQFTRDVVSGAGALRITDTTHSCLALLPIGQCDFDSFVFFNEIFPSGRAHRLWGNALVGAVMRHEFCEDRPQAALCKRE
jgi:cholinesterase